MSAARNAADGNYTPGSGLPLGVPVETHSEATFSQVAGEFGQSREPNTSDSTSTEVPSRPRAIRVGSLQLTRLRDRLSDRDREVLRLVLEHRYLTNYQIQHFCFLDHQSEPTGARVTRRVLVRLERDGLLRKLDRRVGGQGAGSDITIWQITTAGAKVVDREDAKRRRREPSERFLKHCLAVADLHVLLRQHLRIEAIEDVRVEVEPASWRKYQGPGGERRWLQPDLYAEITTADFLDRTFIEVDLSSESLPTLVKKCQQYEDYRRSGIEQSRFGSFPLVVWLFLNERRARRLEQAVQRSSKLTSAMYRYATPETLTQVLAGGGS